MKKQIKSLALVLCLLLLTGCAAGSPAQNVPQESAAPASGTWPLTITDDLGREVTLEAPPQRVTVLTASYAETWLLAGGSMVATVHDAWEDFGLELGEEVQDLGSGQKVSMELIFETEPELIIASSNTKSHVELLETFEQAGVPAVYFLVNTFQDYLHMLSVCCAMGLGIVLGSVAGFYGGWVEMIIMRICEIFEGIPNFLLAITLTAAFGTSLLIATKDAGS